MFLQERELTVDVVEVLHLEGAIFLSEDSVSAAVRQVAVGKDISEIPVDQIIIAKIVLARKTEVISHAALEIVFCLFHIVALSIIALTIGIAILAEEVEDVLHPDALAIVGREPYQAEHCTHTHVVAILIVDGTAQIARLVVSHIVCSEKVVGTVGNRPESIAVIDASIEAKGLTRSSIPSLSHTCRQIHVGHRLAGTHLPVVVQAIFGERIAIALRLQFGVDAIVQATGAIVKTEEVGRTTLIIDMILEVCLGVVVATHADTP